MYAYQDGAGDVGWLYGQDGVSEASYKDSLRWYNQLLCSDPYVVGACLYQVGPGGGWVTFRHTGLDNQGRPLTLMAELAAMAQEPAPAAVAVATTPEIPATAPVVLPVVMAAAPEVPVAAPAAAEPNLPTTLWTAGRPFIIPLNRETKFYQVARERGLGERLTPEYEVLHSDQNYAAQIYEGGLVYAPVGRWDQVEVLPPTRSGLDQAAPAIFWDHHITGFHGNRWMYWDQYVKNQLPGLTLQTFVEEALIYNPGLTADANMLKPDKIYRMPRRADQIPASHDQPAFTPAQAQAQPVAAAVAEITPVAALVAAPPSSDFVQAMGGHFYLKGRPGRFVGVNIRGLVHYSHDTEYLPYAYKEHQLKQLQEAVKMNARLVRLFLAHKDATPEQIEARLAEILALIKANEQDNEDFKNIYLLPVLTNLYCDVPFYVRGDEEFYTLKADKYTILNPTFFKEGYTKNYLPFIRRIVTAFKDEPRIFAWEIGNELKAQYDDKNGAPELLVEFMLQVAQEIKRLDPHHMVTTGMISTRHAWMGSGQPEAWRQLRHKLYGSPHIDFITIHPYNGNEKPENEKEDDSDLTQLFGKPFIIEEAGFNVNNYPNRPEKTRQDMAYWFKQGASCYMPWGFMATDNDNGDGDNDVGIRSKYRDDFGQLYELHKKCGKFLLDSDDNLQELSKRIADIDFTPPPDRAIVELSWPLLTDGFDFPVGKPNGLGYKVDADLLDPDYFEQFKSLHTGEDWNSQTGGDSDLGAPVFAVANGRVVTSRAYPVWGHVILLEHRLPWGQTVWSQYAHLKDRFVRKGEVIRRGEQIGTIGKGDGARYPAHLHFEIRVKELPASKGWGNTSSDREKVRQAYIHPTNFISANRPK